jgi:hypothetical protein
MGGRISGESPREKKAVVRKCRAGAVLLYQTNDAGDAVTATAARQASKQQLAVWRPFGQQDL